MTSGKQPDLVPAEVLSEVQAKWKRFESLSAWKGYAQSTNSLFTAAFKRAFPFDPRFNAVYWAQDVDRLVREIGFGVFWMKAYANYYRQQKKRWEGKPSHVDFHVSYFADNCIARLDSCRDKIALMVWAFYVPFNPEEKVLIYEQVLQKLRCPVKFGLNLSNHRLFLKDLEALNTQDFNVLKKYRDLKIHRREPRIEIFGVDPAHDTPYMLPVRKDRLKAWEASKRKHYSNWEDWAIQDLIQDCCINGVPFEQRKLKNRVWGYERIKGHIERGLAQILGAVSGCFRLLRRRPPLRARHVDLAHRKPV